MLFKLEIVILAGEVREDAWPGSSVFLYLCVLRCSVRKAGALCSLASGAAVLRVTVLMLSAPLGSLGLNMTTSPQRQVAENVLRNRSKVLV